MARIHAKGPAGKSGPGCSPGALAFLLREGCGPLARLPWRFVPDACAGGAPGFPLGAALQARGCTAGALPRLDGWKGTEFSFGTLPGAGFGMAAWLTRRELKPARPQPERRRESPRPGTCCWRQRPWPSSLGSSAGSIWGFTGAWAQLWRWPAVSARTSSHATRPSRRLSRPSWWTSPETPRPRLARAAGRCAAALPRRPRGVARNGSLGKCFSPQKWAAVAVSLARTFVPPWLASPGHLLAECAFVLMAGLCVRMARRAFREEAAAAPAVAS